MGKINLMLRLLAVLFISGMVFQSCLKDHQARRKAEELRILKEYITQENITVSPTSSGLYYVEQVEGTGSFPGPTDWIEFTFTGRLVSNPQIIVMTSDSLTARNNNIYSPYILYGPNRFRMNTLFMEGLIEGISKMKAGGKARLIFPSDLGYGERAVGYTPAYSSLIIDVELIHVITNIVQFERANLIAYLKANNIIEDSTSTGLYYHEIFPGTGDFPTIGKKVTINYMGRFLSGKIFTQTDEGEPYTFIVGYDQVIDGVEQGIKLMKKGGQARLIVPFHLAYGESGYTYQDNYNYFILVWPYSTLIYDIELITIE